MFCLATKMARSLLESKTLGLLARDALPTRPELSGDVRKHVYEARKQLTGAIRSIRRGLRITDSDGLRDISSTGAPCRTPTSLSLTLGLLSRATDLDGDFFEASSRELDGFLHILDVVELLRIVQSAEIISQQSSVATLLMAFDYYLLKRAELSWSAHNPDFHVVLKTEK